MKTWESEGLAAAFLTSAIDGDEWPDSHTVALTHRENRTQ
jgi:hypothetical protein